MSVIHTTKPFYSVTNKRRFKPKTPDFQSGTSIADTNIRRAEQGEKTVMFKTVNFNIYEEDLEDVVYGEKNKESKKQEQTQPVKDRTDKPIPKPPPQYWTNPLSYRRFSHESDGTSNIL